jgi:CheY-like chemotaxis protein
MKVSPTRFSSDWPASTLSVQPAAVQRKVLSIDSGSENQRKARIAAFKKLGFTVHPALSVQQARSRCQPGRYDLIVVVTGEDWEPALQLCDEIRAREPRQALILVAAPGLPIPERSYIVADDAELLRERIEGFFGKEPNPVDSEVAA